MRKNGDRQRFRVDKEVPWMGDDTAFDGTYAAVHSVEADRDIFEDLHSAGAIGRFAGPIVSVRMKVGDDDYLIPPPRGASILRLCTSVGRAHFATLTPTDGGDREPKEPRQ